MGYTHYFDRPAILDPETYQAWAGEVKSLRDKLPRDIIIADGHREESPAEFSSEAVWFNGLEDEGHETFYVPQVMDDDTETSGLIFNFCKTARKPYDLLVGAALLSLKHYFPQVRVSSDGDAEDWKEIVAFYEEVTGRKAEQVW
jgi:hypothetical protein